MPVKLLERYMDCRDSLTIRLGHGPLQQSRYLNSAQTIGTISGTKFQKDLVINPSNTF